MALRDVWLRWRWLLISVGAVVASRLVAPFVPEAYKMFVVFFTVVGVVQVNWQLYMHRRLFGKAPTVLKRLHFLYAAVSTGAILLGKLFTTTQESPFIVFVYAVLVSNV